jgi:hypothetical protein
VSHFTHLGQKPQAAGSKAPLFLLFSRDLRVASRGTLRAASHVTGAQHDQEEPDMEWTTPEFVEVKMDAEINSYQDDFSGV